MQSIQKPQHSTRIIFALVVLGTLAPMLATSFGMCFDAPGGGGVNLPFLQWNFGGRMLLMDSHLLGLAMAVALLAVIYCRFTPCHSALVMGASFLTAGLIGGILVVPAPDPAGANEAVRRALALTQAGAFAVILTGAILARRDTGRTAGDVGRVLGLGAVVMAVVWTGQMRPQVAAGLGAGASSLIGEAFLLAAAAVLAGQALRPRALLFDRGAAAALAPLLALPLAVTGPSFGGPVHGLHVAAMLRWTAWLVPVLCLGADLLRAMFFRTLSVEQSHLRTVIDAIPHFIFARDAQGRFTLANKAVAEFYGRTVEELEGQYLADIHPDPDQVFVWLQEDRETLARRRQWTLPVVRTTNAEGENLWILAVKTPLHPDRLDDDQVLGISIDVTERMLAEDALADRMVFERTSASILETFVHCTEQNLEESLDASLAQVASLAEGTRCLLYRFDPETGDADLFHRWELPEWADGPRPADVIDAGKLEWVRHMFANKLFLTAGRQDDLPDSAHGFWAGLGLAPDGSLLASPIHSGGSLFGFVVIVAEGNHRWTPEDTGLLRLVGDLFITVHSKFETEASLRLAIEAAHQSSRAKSDFLANMSHEIRTPLNCVIGITDLLAEMDPSPGQTQYLEMIRQSGSSLLNLINDILDLSKIEAGQLELDPLDTNLRQLVDEIAGLAAFTAQAKGLEMVCRLAPGCPERVVIDPGRLRQVLTNLLNNATKFTKEGHVYLNVEPVGMDGDRVLLRFEVSDTGIGIEQTKLDRVFDKFTQADSGTTRRFGGTGLGLSISQQLVGLMGGRITAGSTPGEGSTFGFTLPVKVESGPVPAAVQPDGSQQRVLVITGHELSGEVLAEQVRHLGHRCEVAVGLPDVRKLLDGTAGCGDEHGWSFILLDQSTAEEDVPLVNRHLETLPEDQRPRVILMTNLSSLQRERDLMGQGFAGTLNKPVSPARLGPLLVGDHQGVQRTVELAAPDGAASPFACPFSPADSEAAAARAGAVDEAVGGPRVLLAEDNPFNQKVAASMLGLLGCRVTVAVTGVEAVAMAQDEDFDVVFMDCQMPAMDGYEATRRIRLIPGERAKVPIIAMTANVMSGDRQACFECGMDDFLSKPISKTMLEDMLAKWDLLAKAGV